jgi:hypothetical protein
VTPTQRSLAKLRAEGYAVGVVERWNAHVRIRQDLFGFIDLIAMNDTETVAIQTTSGSNVAARITKIEESEHAKLWLACPHRRIIVHGWRKVSVKLKNGNKALRWQCREVEVTG